jgi:hypothetical protein
MGKLTGTPARPNTLRAAVSTTANSAAPVTTNPLAKVTSTEYAPASVSFTAAKLKLAPVAPVIFFPAFFH